MMIFKHASHFIPRSYSASIRFYNRYPEELSSIILEKNKDKSHINFTPHGAPHLAGAFVERVVQGKSSTIRKIDRQEVLSADVIAIGGIDFDSPRTLSALLRDTAYLLTVPGRTLNTKLIAYCPLQEKEERYDEARKVNDNAQYFSSHAMHFVRSHLLPRFLNKHDKLRRWHEIRYPAFLTFSLGARDGLMIQNALIHILKTEYYLSDSELTSYIRCLSTVNIGAAIDWLQVTTNFPRITVTSIEDLGILLPQKFIDTYLLHPEAQKEPYSLFNNARIRSNAFGEYVIIIGKEQLPIIIDETKINLEGHSLPHYIEAIKTILPAKLQLTIMHYLAPQHVQDIIPQDPSTWQSRLRGAHQTGREL